MTLNSVCDVHGHEEGLPDRELRAHILNAAVHTVHRELVAHGYGDLERSVEILHVACEDALDDADEPDLTH